MGWNFCQIVEPFGTSLSQKVFQKMVAHGFFYFTFLTALSLDVDPAWLEAVTRQV